MTVLCLYVFISRFLVLITGQMRALQVAYSCIEALLKLSLSDDVMLLRSRQSKMNTWYYFYYYYISTVSYFRRNSKSVSRIHRVESTWSSWAERCSPTSWRTRRTSGWPARNIRRRASRWCRSSASASVRRWGRPPVARLVPKNTDIVTFRWNLDECCWRIKSL